MMNLSERTIAILGSVTFSLGLLFTAISLIPNRDAPLIAAFMMGSGLGLLTLTSRN